ncbi:hypothetical protein DFP72DRAFT_844805 [Ephemerocybe angulata]|uniref:Uncharacterized protein n=1 Tax=Ephemerocybe angulata TaxID=980116 RepID=A0A8H6I5A8_9AGAR|nr:hypothetical protein DFP72DRAFT_844805 [Tulosesus angulatus]
MPRDSTTRSDVQWVILAISSLQAEGNAITYPSIRLAIRDDVRSSGYKGLPPKEAHAIQGAVDILRNGHVTRSSIESGWYPVLTADRWDNLAAIPLDEELSPTFWRSLRSGRRVPYPQSRRQQDKISELHNTRLQRFSDLVELKLIAQIAKPMDQIEEVMALRAEVESLNSKCAKLVADVASLTAKAVELEAGIDLGNRHDWLARSITETSHDLHSITSGIATLLPTP